MREAGLPPGVFNFVTGPARPSGQELIDNDGIDGIVFTGSKEVGMKLIRDNAARAGAAAADHRNGRKESRHHHAHRPISKRPPTASCARRSARRGRNARRARASTSQKDVRDEFVQLLVEKTKRIKIGNPLERDVWMGPVINEAAVRTY